MCLGCFCLFFLFLLFLICRLGVGAPRLVDGRVCCIMWLCGFVCCGDACVIAIGLVVAAMWVSSFARLVPWICV